MLFLVLKQHLDENILDKMNFEILVKELKTKVKLNIEYVIDAEEKSEFIGISSKK